MSDFVYGGPLTRNMLEKLKLLPDVAIEASLTICLSSFILIRLLIVVPKIPRQVPTTDPITDLRKNTQLINCRVDACLNNKHPLGLYY